MTKGREKVEELNNRFADWYYVISNDIYKKIHLDRSDIMKKPESEKKGNARRIRRIEEGIDAGAAPAASSEKK